MADAATMWSAKSLSVQCAVATTQSVNSVLAENADADGVAGAVLVAAAPQRSDSLLAVCSAQVRLFCGGSVSVSMDDIA